MKIRNLLMGAAVVLALGAVQSGYAWKHTFVSPIEDKTRWKVTYATLACSDDAFSLDPGKSKTNEVVGCSLEHVEAWVIAPQRDSNGAIVKKLDGTISYDSEVHATTYSGPYSADGTWKITTSLDSKGKKKYKVERTAS